MHETLSPKVKTERLLSRAEKHSFRGMHSKWIVRLRGRPASAPAALQPVPSAGQRIHCKLLSTADPARLQTNFGVSGHVGPLSGGEILLMEETEELLPSISATFVLEWTFVVQA